MTQAHAQLEQMNLNLMLALHWLLAERSVTRAARRMGVTQSAMSRSLAQLRGFFGDPLFVSVGRRLEPTARAMAVRERLAEVVDTLRGLLGPAAPFEPELADGTLTIAATEHAMLSVMRAFVAALRRGAPRLNVRVEPATPDAFARLAGGQLDLLVGPNAGPLRSELRAKTLAREEFATVLRRAHPAAGRSLTLRRFCALEHVVVHPLGGTRQSQVSRALAQQGLERRVVLQVPYFSSALALVAKNDLVLTLPASLAPARLAVRQPPLVLPGFVLQAVWPRRLHDSELHRWVRGLLPTVESPDSAEVAGTHSTG